MEHWIEHPSEPSELILSWQAPELVEDRTRWAVGRLSLSSAGARFEYFGDEALTQLNCGRTRSELVAAGYAGYPAFDLIRQPKGGFTDGVIEAFARRLPPASRPDFGRFLEHYRFRGGTTLSTMGLLALTEARLPSDGFSLVDPLDPGRDCVEVVVEVAGHRHYSSTHAALAVGEPLDLVLDPDNVHDVNAVRVEAKGELIGHVNRLQAETVGRWLTTRQVQTWIVRLNGQPSSPRVIAFLQVRPSREAMAA